MRALTLIRPWAWALFHGKPVENRCWWLPSRYWGERVAIHAGKQWDKNGERFVLKQLGLVTLPPEAWRQGVVGTLVFDRAIEPLVYGCTPTDPVQQSPWFFGPFGWVHRDAIDLAQPIPCRGMLGFWTLPADVEAQVRAQIEETERHG